MNARLLAWCQKATGLTRKRPSVKKYECSPASLVPESDRFDKEKAFSQEV